MRFALVDREVARPAIEAELELVLATGERLRIGRGVAWKTPRMVAKLGISSHRRSLAKPPFFGFPGSGGLISDSMAVRYGVFCKSLKGASR
jgi:hypothetical protein